VVYRSVYRDVHYPTIPREAYMGGIPPTTPTQEGIYERIYPSYTPSGRHIREVLPCYTHPGRHIGRVMPPRRVILAL